MAVTPHMKISEVLKQHPQLLDVLVAQSPHFSRLKNPILRHVQSRLVTVAQAAAIAGLEPGTLVRNLNAALGEHDVAVGSFKVESMAGTPPPPWLETAALTATVDVRDDQHRRQDPFAKIMATVSRMQEGEAFLLRNTFEPFPLYDVLGKRGFVSWARQDAPEDWSIYFFKAGKGQSEHGAEQAAQSMPVPAAACPTAGEPAVTITVDVRDLVPPQPMMRIMDALDKLGPGQTLLVHHVRRPVYLYPRLAEMGYTHETRELAADKIEIYIRKP